MGFIKKDFVYIITTGFIVLLLLSLPLYWMGWSCQTAIQDRIERFSSSAKIQPSLLVPEEFEYEPNNVVKHSYVSTRMRTAGYGYGLGIKEYFESIKSPDVPSSHFWDRTPDGYYIYFDAKTGFVVHCTITQRNVNGKKVWTKKINFYIGPDGFSDSRDKKIGRFSDPIIDKEAVQWQTALTLYDKEQRRFFAIDFEQETVTKGPQLAKDSIYEPIQIGRLIKNPSLLYLKWEPPMTKAPVEAKGDDKMPRRRRISKRPFFRMDGLEPIVNRLLPYSAGGYILVLDKTGRIDLLNKNTLEFVGKAGELLEAPNFFSDDGEKAVTPKELLSYEVLPLVLDTDGQYRGCFVASLSGQGYGYYLTVFDQNGRKVAGDRSGWAYSSRGEGDVYSISSLLFQCPGGIALTIAKFLSDNLQPPILSVTSYFSASTVEAGAGHRALFILPNSFFAMFGRGVSENYIARFFTALLFILPSIVLSLLLAWRVNKDARIVGLDSTARRWWFIGTLGFGLSAYITYRLTRPKITLVTCQNCGKPRRPDMERCHQCSSKWTVPELIAPRWRVIED